ncbi:hypothetical protein ASPZODRAFT_132896 [Penicilliopsis zonata CBS 506.65]|uniref:Phosphatidylglycerol/phosphatidylinositol transfer protein n=1 Tax=Penicilliopsis zonata CBS 506.65 TaxID=1073090 RepID=A0A1L9SHU8_9EURO|nr:hypothetical protein ASPZODRAFT_132896 [Penicilliopsis zonata CBS 506.65]OJJ46758.1 hypothetical protein ASPZODRAFT_132896 [Penicilliopsis zonata CBS 506.65]
MKFLSPAATVVGLLAPISVGANPLSLWPSSQAPIHELNGPAVPGDNPLFHCAIPTDDILQIQSVELVPNPPKAGQALKIRASGILTETVEKGATVLLDVKWNNVITLVHQTVDLCEQIKNVDLECPLEKGPLVLEKEVALPAQIPKGKFSVLADVLSKDEDKITCLQADNIQF